MFERKPVFQEVGGLLTEEDLLRAIEKIRNQAPRPDSILIPDSILMSVRTLESGRYHAFVLECSVGHAEDELLRTRRWRRLRRRLLRRQIGQRSRQALGMRNIFRW